MEKQSTFSGKHLTILKSVPSLAGILVLAGLYLAADLYKGFPFHSLIELFGVVVAGGMFMFAWNSRHFQDSDYFLLIGIAYLFVGGMDLVHVIIYQNVRLLQGSDLNLSIQIRVAARYVESISLLLAPLFVRPGVRGKPGGELKTRYMFLGYSAAVSLLLGFIFFGRFPDCFIRGAGLTLFNTISEAGICFALLSAIALLAQKRRKFDPKVLWLLIASIAVTVLSELAFTFFTYATPISNLTGHVLETISYYLIYKAIVETGLMEPYRVLFRNLKQSEESVKSAYTELDQIFNTTANAIRLIDKDLNVLKTNRRFLTLVGLSQDEATGKKCYEAFSTSACHTPRCSMNRILGGEELIEFDVEIVRRDGVKIPCSVTVTPFLGPDGELIGIVENLKDITEHKAMEDKLREERDRAQQYLDVVGVIILVIGADQKVRLINKKGCEILGYQEREILGRKWFDNFVPERVKNEMMAAFGNSETGEIKLDTYFENPVLTKNGEERLISWHNTALYDDKGRITATLSSGEDITERKQAEAALSKRTYDLDERVKELNCLYGISHLVETPDISLEEILQGTLDFIPPAWQYPEITCARIIVEGKEFKTKNFEETAWKQSSGIMVDGDRVGAVEVYYLKEKPEIDEGPFLREERRLINAIAEEAGKIIRRARTELALRESEEKFRLVTETVQDVFWMTTPGITEILYISPAYEKVWGLSRESIYKDSLSFIDAVHPDDRERVLSEFENKPTGTWDLEYRVVRPDGSVRWIYDRGFPVHDKDGEISKIVGVAADITERKLAEEELKKYRSHLEELVRERTAELARAVDLLRESEIKYSTLIEKARDGVMLIQDGVYTFVNEYMTKITGYSIEELIGTPVVAIVADEYKDMLDKRIRSRLAGEDVVSQYETKIQTKDGELKDVEMSVGLIPYRGEPAIIGIMRDITERKRTEQELQRAQKLESLGILAGGIAHDFNNLLTAIIGNLSLLDKYIKSEQRASEILWAVKKASSRAKHLTHQLLTFSKGGVPVKKAASIADLIEETAGFSLSGSRAQCELSLPDDLWWAEIDEGQIGQVINNLVINADQAMPEGGTISISAENVIVRLSDGLPLKEGRYIRIAVKDQGIGIPESSIPKIFDPFFTTKPDGNGLGLAITYSIIKKHGGYITVESRARAASAGTGRLRIGKLETGRLKSGRLKFENSGIGSLETERLESGRLGMGSAQTGSLDAGSVDAGTTFFIYLPASEKELFTVQGVAEENSLPTVSSYYQHGHGQGKILFMDDQPNIREMTMQMLDDLGYEVRVAREGGEAIKLYEEAQESGHPFDAVILDLTVPGGMGGDEAIRKLREIDPEVKAIVSSGYSNDLIMSEYREYGFRDVVAKPYEIKKLSWVLHKVMREGKEIFPPR
jgi:PAS domain S-box-containing protein